MAKTRTIQQAISDVLGASTVSMSADEIFAEIISRELYEFPAKDPLAVVKSTLRRHCVNRDFPTARRKKFFSVDDQDRYSLLPKPAIAAATAFRAKSSGSRKATRIISVPPDDESDPNNADAKGTTHNEIQWRLLDLGARLGMNVWAPKNDRGRMWGGRVIGDVPNMLDKLPQQFDDSAMEIISYIDVIWLQNRALFAAFEVEHTTQIYPGLLRMADLMTLVPKSGHSMVHRVSGRPFRQILSASDTTNVSRWH
ncbi:MAG: hypothetical protein U0936_24300 [Planctomycetaceae bacterium]